MITNPDKPRRGRPPKQRDVDTAEPVVEGTRRRRSDGPGIIGQRLGVNTDKLDFNDFKYRWVNDEPGRLYQMTVRGDWNIVNNRGGAIKENSDDLGDAVSHIVGTKADGSPLLTYLCREPKVYYEEDQKKKSEELDEQLDALRRGNSRDGASQSDYVPSGGIRIG